MARLSVGADRAAEIARVMREAGVDEVQAAFFVALARGEVDSDVVPDRPLTPEERRRIGLGIVAFDEPPEDDDDELSGGSVVDAEAGESLESDGGLGSEDGRSSRRSRRPSARR